MTKPTLRALGIEFLQQYVSDKPTFIQGALQEHEQYLEHPLEPLYLPARTLKERITDTYGDTRIYDLVAWFLEEIGILDVTDEYLQVLVKHEYDSARNLQYYDDHRIFATYDEVKSKGNGRLLHMSDIVEALKGSGY